MNDSIIYVDPLFFCIPNPRWRYNKSCHLFSVNDPGNIELHKFAKEIGLRKSWFQNSKFFPHYDLTSNKRLSAVRNKAVECDRKFAVEVRKERIAKYEREKEASKYDGYGGNFK